MGQGGWCFPGPCSAQQRSWWLPGVGVGSAKAQHLCSSQPMPDGLPHPPRLVLLPLASLLPAGRGETKGGPGEGTKTKGQHPKTAAVCSPQVPSADPGEPVLPPTPGGPSHPPVSPLPAPSKQLPLCPRSPVPCRSTWRRQPARWGPHHVSSHSLMVRSSVPRRGRAGAGPSHLCPHPVMWTCSLHTPFLMTAAPANCTPTRQRTPDPSSFRTQLRPGGRNHICGMTQ